MITMSDVLIDRPELESLGQYEFGWHDTDAGAVAQRGINEDVVRGISSLKSEPEWMLKTRLKGYQLFGKKPMPTWGADLSDIDFDNIKYFVRRPRSRRSRGRTSREEIRNTYE
ncbi:Fe-S cluster assembly protein SufB, partial [Microbacterium sp. SUBG005]